jgi:hypothetical protein
MAHAWSGDLLREYLKGGAKCSESAGSFDEEMHVWNCTAQVRTEPSGRSPVYMHISMHMHYIAMVHLPRSVGCTPWKSVQNTIQNHITFSALLSLTLSSPHLDM